MRENFSVVHHQIPSVSIYNAKSDFLTIHQVWILAPGIGKCKMREAYAKNVREKATKCSLKVIEVLSWTLVDMCLSKFYIDHGTVAPKSHADSWCCHFFAKKVLCDVPSKNNLLRRNINKKIILNYTFLLFQQSFFCCYTLFSQRGNWFNVSSQKSTLIFLSLLLTVLWFFRVFWIEIKWHACLIR